jgi:hypothetical protein
VDPIDEQTLNALADLICGDNTLYYRTAEDLVKFFRRAGWSHIAVYDGYSRRSWTIHQLQRKRDDPEAIASVLRRLVDQREYPGQLQLVPEIQLDLNRLLEAENIHVEIDDDLRPHVKPGRYRPPEKHPDPLSRTTLLYRIEDIVADPDLVPLLNQRIDEIDACRESGCYLAAVVLAGSLLEGILLDAAEKRPIPDQIWDEPAAKEEKIRRAKSSSDWNLHTLAYVAHRLGWIDTDAHEVGKALRKFRNLVHVNLQRTIVGRVPDADTINMFWPIVVGTINDLGRTNPK